MQSVTVSNTFKANKKNCTNILEVLTKILGMDGNQKHSTIFSMTNQRFCSLWLIK